MTRLFPIVCLALLIAWAAPQRSYGADPELETAIRELLDETHALATMKLVRERVSESIWTYVKQASPDVPSSTSEMIRDETDKIFAEAEPEFLEAVIEIDSRYFTADEVRQILEFYRTDAGKKSLQVLPDIAADSMKLGLAWGQKAGALARKRVIQKLRAQGYEL